MTALLGAGLAVAGSLFGANSASKAASAQADAAVEAAKLQVAEQRRQYDQTRSDYEPYRQSGINNLNALNYYMGIGPMPGSEGSLSYADIPSLEVVTTNNASPFSAVRTGPRDNSFGAAIRNSLAGGASAPAGGSTTSFKVGDASFSDRAAAEEYLSGLRSQAAGSEFVGFQETPGYQFALEQNEKALERAAAARGVRLSGATFNEAARQAQGMQNQEFNTYLNRLASGAGQGQTAVNSLSSFGQNTANSISNAYANQGAQVGAARASGYQGVNNAIQGGLGNLATLNFMYPDMFGG